MYNVQYVHVNIFTKKNCRYQHSRHLVTTLNQFADVKADLPKGWEKKLNKEGKVGGHIRYMYQQMYSLYIHVVNEVYMYV